MSRFRLLSSISTGCMFSRLYRMASEVKAVYISSWISAMKTTARVFSTMSESLALRMTYMPPRYARAMSRKSFGRPTTSMDQSRYTEPTSCNFHCLAATREFRPMLLAMRKTDMAPVASSSSLTITAPVLGPPLRFKLLYIAMGWEDLSTGLGPCTAQSSVMMDRPRRMSDSIRTSNTKTHPSSRGNNVPEQSETSRSWPIFQSCAMKRQTTA
mmetsp:Transcript_6118/g.17454  ORF Transcript_6118/g.17454 Transcript_6118/m.17454 type:complete len:213 (-) Transcript_6118:198-836(-)